MSIVNIIQSIDKLDWTDLEHSPLADIPNNNFYKVEPQQQCKQTKSLRSQVLHALSSITE
jgi:hypothetical protein